MSDSIKRIFLFLLMFIVVISLTTLASSLQIKEVEIIFSDGTKTHLTVSANKTAEEILKENKNIFNNKSYKQTNKWIICCSNCHGSCGHDIILWTSI